MVCSKIFSKTFKSPFVNMWFHMEVGKERDRGSQFRYHHGFWLPTYQKVSSHTTWCCLNHCVGWSVQSSWNVARSDKKGQAQDSGDSPEGNSLRDGKLVPRLFIDSKVTPYNQIDCSSVTLHWLSGRVVFQRYGNLFCKYFKRKAILTRVSWYQTK